jgi:hypothetical protein
MFNIRRKEKEKQKRIFRWKQLIHQLELHTSENGRTKKRINSCKKMIETTNVGLDSMRVLVDSWLSSC